MILHINDTFATGGTERVIVEQSRWLNDCGYAVRAIALQPPTELLESESVLFDWHCLNVPPKTNPAKCAAALRKHLLQIKPAVVHVHSFFGLLVEHMAFPIKRPYRLITSLHNMGYDAWPAKTVREKMRKRLHAYLLKRCDAVTAVSSGVAFHYEQHCGVTTNQVISNPLPRDVERIMQDDSFSLSDGWPLRHWVIPGRVTREKGHEFAIAAFAHLLGGGHDLKLSILGDGPLRTELESLCQKFGIGDRVTFHPSLSRSKFLREFQSADLCVVPSTSEGFGIVALEALALGVPLIASDVGGLSELVQDGGNGVLFESANADAICSAFRGLLASRAQVEDMKEEGRKTAARFQLDVIGEKWVELYELV